MANPKVGQKFSIGGTKIEVSAFPAKGTFRFDVKVNGLQAGSIIALGEIDVQGAMPVIDAFYVAGNRRQEYQSAKAAATALAKSLLQ